jgi:tartrate dehydratase beta subunit/fumarate hydratase class I family protein
MSVEFNSVMTQAINDAHRRRAAATGVTDQTYTTDSIKGTAFVGSELSVEDITNAIKAKNTKKHEDNHFISNHTQVKDKKDDDIMMAAGPSQASMRINQVAEQMESKLNLAQKTAEKSFERKSNVAESMRSTRKNPFI